MGICYEGRALWEMVEDKDRLFRETRCIYGLEKLELTEDDPAKFMRFQMGLVAGCISARETAKLISANPVSLLMGELLFMLATPEGDVVAASYGLIGHVQSFPFIIRSIAELDFESDPGIRDGDIFSTNDPYYGAPHASDCYNFVPVFYEGELLAWAVGVNHITDVGGVLPGNLSGVSPNTFADGFTYPPLKTGEGFRQHKWWELFWKRRTRTAAFNILDDKMRTTGALMVRDRVLEVVREFGPDYFRRGLREILERERRVVMQRVRTQAVPGVYRFLAVAPIRYKGVVGKLFPSSDRDWLLHEPADLHILPDGSIFIDLEGLTSEADFHCNSYEPSVRMNTLAGWWPMIGYTTTTNTSINYMCSWNIPPGSMFNPQNPFAATIMGLGESGKYLFTVHNCFSYAFFARGFIEECFPQDPVGIGYGLDGVLADGTRWAGGNLTFIAGASSHAFPYKDGDPAIICAPNPAADLGEVEQHEFLEPTNVNLGKKMVPNYCGHGKFRSGLGLGMCQLICDPGQYLTIGVYGEVAETSRVALGMSGGYPGAHEVTCFVHDTNMRDILSEGKGYPTDFVEVKEWLKAGKLKAARVEYYTGSSPAIELKDGDLFLTATAARGGWGDPLEREFSMVERDLKYGWIAPNIAKSVYAVVTDEQGNVNTAESNRLRKHMRTIRKEKSLDARDWWKKERARVINKGFSEEVYNMYVDCLKYAKFRRQFFGMWQLPEDTSY